MVEGGWPGSNPKDAEFFARVGELDLKHAQLAAFGATRLPRRGVDDDANLAALLAANTPIVTLVGKAWTLHVDEALRTTREENLAMVADSVAYMAAEGGGWCSTPSTSSTATAPTAATRWRCSTPPWRRAPTRWCCATPTAARCPTTPPAMVDEVTGRSRARVGVHFHNDAACAVANSVVAVSGGALHVQGAANGYGERCGNADLFAIIAGLELKRGHELLPPGRLAELASTARAIAELANLPLASRQPYVGSSAFATKAGCTPPRSPGGRTPTRISTRGGRQPAAGAGQ